MHKILLIILFVTYFGMIIAFAIIRKRAAEKSIKIFRAEDWNDYCGKEWRDFSCWIHDHPFGAITSEERLERNNLVYYLQGSYFLYCQSKRIYYFTDPYALWLDQQIEDWSMS